jgi:uncharacterized membrane-anchored protein YjiN (DUF445 family)
MLFPELIQNRASSYNIARNILEWVNNPDKDLELRRVLSKTAELVQGEEQNVGLRIGKVIKQCY